MFFIAGGSPCAATTKFPPCCKRPGDSNMFPFWGPLFFTKP